MVITLLRLVELSICYDGNLFFWGWAVTSSPLAPILDGYPWRGLSYWCSLDGIKFTYFIHVKFSCLLGTSAIFFEGFVLFATPLTLLFYLALHSRIEIIKEIIACLGYCAFVLECPWNLRLMIPLDRSGSSLFIDLLLESFNDEIIIVFSWSLG